MCEYSIKSVVCAFFGKCEKNLEYFLISTTNIKRLAKIKLLYFCPSKTGMLIESLDDIACNMTGDQSFDPQTKTLKRQAIGRKRNRIQ